MSITSIYIQTITLLIWAVATMFFINYGGRNNGIFRIVVSTGFRLIIIGAVAAAIVGATGNTENKIFTDAAIQFILVLSAGVGGSYIAHANMSLRDFPNKSNGPEMLPGLEPSKSVSTQKQKIQSKRKRRG